MNRTGIEWARCGLENGFTWNPVVGCTHGCPYCYARGMAKRVAGVTGCDQCATFTPHLHPERLAEPERRKTPSGIFVGSMCDLWDPSVPQAWRVEVYRAMEAAPAHRYALLTKRPVEMLADKDARYRDVNVAIGISVTNTQDVDRLRGPSVLVNDCGLFLSCEPLLGRIPDLGNDEWARWLVWIIIGAETGRRVGRVEPKPEWIAEIVDAADALEIPVFLKNNLAPYLPAGMALRQEWPEGWGAA